jgi:hypothetical protein
MSPGFDPDRMTKIYTAWCDYLEAEENGRVWPPYRFMPVKTEQEAQHAAL